MTGHTISFKTSNTILVPVGELTLGMRVTDLDRPWEDTPFLFQGFTIGCQEELDTLRRLCNHVIVDVFGTVDVQLTPGKAQRRAPKTARITKVARTPAYKHPVERELKHARSAYRDSTKLIRTMLDDVRLGLAIDTPQAKELVSTCVDSILRNPDALLLLTRTTIPPNTASMSLSCPCASGDTWDWSTKSLSNWACVDYCTTLVNYSRRTTFSINPVGCRRTNSKS